MKTADQCPQHGFHEGENCPTCVVAGRAPEHYELTRPATPVDYLILQAVLDRAFEQAAYGKGAARHARNLAFEDQPMQKLIDLYGVGFAFGQAAKKLQEAQGMLLRGEIDAAVREMLGAIVYTAGAVIHVEKAHGG